VPSVIFEGFPGANKAQNSITNCHEAMEYSYWIVPMGLHPFDYSGEERVELPTVQLVSSHSKKRW
jgi:hypothetical protein